MQTRLALFLGVLIQLSGATERTALRTPSSGVGPFTRLGAEETGIAFVAPLDVEHSMKYLYHSGFACGSVTLGDVNADGWPDVFVAGGPANNALYLQDPKQALRFEDHAEALGVDGGNRWGSGSVFVDIDNDGDLDLYVCQYRGKHQLFVNQLVPKGTLAFEERAAEFGLDIVNASLTPAFADIDLDGDLDLFMLNNRLERPQGRPTKPPYEVVDGKPQVLPEYALYYHIHQEGESGFKMDVYGQPDRLYRNDNGKFQDVTTTSGIAGIGHGLSATWWDYNMDGYPDLYVGNDFTDPDRLYRNNKDGTFTEVLAETMPYCSWSSMGSASADLNNDGLPDLFSADMAATSHFKQKVNMGDMSRFRWLMETGWPRQMMRNMLYVNTGIHRFKEMAFMSGLARSDWTWAVKLADYDNDGWVDLYLSNGMARNFSDADIPMTPEMLIGRTEFEIYQDGPPLEEKNRAYRNTGGLNFQDVSGEWGLDDLGMSYGAAHGDLDRDGDLDLVVINLDAPLGVYRNDMKTGNRLVLQLDGVQSNRSGWGSRIELSSKQGRQMRFHHPTTGFQGADLGEVHFGLGDDVSADVVIRWPSGKRTRLADIKAGYRYVISEKDAADGEDGEKSGERLFTEQAAALKLAYTHGEKPFDDYAAQPLLPGKLSQLGPGMAWGDFDGDGDDDVYFGGAAGGEGAVYSADGGKFVSVAGPWSMDKACEDMGAVWLDADLDGDLDLFVASGGVESALGAEALRDRLYLNEGANGFARASEDAFPKVGYSSSAVTASDVDRDGDVDLFIGSRSIPGKYPVMPKSRWLRNESQPGRVRFVEMKAPDEMGLVTGATWMDVNDDGWQDLVVVTEWGSPRVLVSDNGTTFVDKTEEAGLSGYKGWWNGICPGDLDGDGDLDFVATNVGLNTKYGNPSAKKPSLLYYGDMDGSGVGQLIEAKPGEEGLLPVRGRSCSSHAMPFIAKKFESYRAFAAADLQAIYTPNRLDEAERFEATEFRSGVFLNESSGNTIRFVFQALPSAAQASPCYGVSVQDDDGDGRVDITLVGNHYTREPETGLWRGFMGMRLLGDGKGGFTEQDYALSGFVVPGDGKSLGRADVNGDGAPDQVAMQNDDRVLSFINGTPSKRFLAVRLQARHGNPTALGASVVVRFKDGSRQRMDVHGGSGYLSQSSPECYFGLGEGVPLGVDVRWPDGTATQHPITSMSLRLLQP